MRNKVFKHVLEGSDNFSYLQRHYSEKIMEICQKDDFRTFLNGQSHYIYIIATSNPLYNDNQKTNISEQEITLPAKK